MHDASSRYPKTTEVKHKLSGVPNEAPSGPLHLSIKGVNSLVNQGERHNP